MNPNDWDDDRLKRTLETRAAGSPPPGLEDDVMARVRASTRRSSGFPAVSLLAAAAIALAVVVVASQVPFGPSGGEREQRSAAPYGDDDVITGPSSDVSPTAAPTGDGSEPVVTLEPGSSTPPPVRPSDGPSVAIPTLAPDEASDGALLPSIRLAGDPTLDGGCLWGIDASGFTVSVVWPHGYRALFDPVRLIDTDGTVVAVEGDLLDLGGGEGTDAPDRCDIGRPVWLAGTVAPAATAGEAEQAAPDRILGVWGEIRAQSALIANPDHIRELAEDPSSVRGEMGVPFSPEHAERIGIVPTDEDEPTTVLQRYGNEHWDVFGGLFIDNDAGRLIDVAFTRDIAEHEAALRELVPAGTELRVRAVRHTLAELWALQNRVGNELFAADSGINLYSTSTNVFDNVVEIEGSAADPDAAEASLRDRYGADALRVTLHPEPEPEPSQPQEGEGWRLLAELEGAGHAYTVGVARDQQEFEALWSALGTAPPEPEVDFSAEIVIHFGATVSGSCPQITLDDVVVDAEERLVYGQISYPIPPGMPCTSDANPHAFVVAVPRDRLPQSPFTVRLEREVRCLGCGGSEEVTVDLAADAGGQSPEP